jgi:hypothetical protein
MPMLFDIYLSDIGLFVAFSPTTGFQDCSVVIDPLLSKI